MFISIIQSPFPLFLFSSNHYVRYPKSNRVNLKTIRKVNNISFEWKMINKIIMVDILIKIIGLKLD